MIPIKGTRMTFWCRTRAITARKHEVPIREITKAAPTRQMGEAPGR